jgi:hypothetical protein
MENYLFFSHFLGWSDDGGGLLESANTLCLEDQRVPCKHVTSAEAVGPGSSFGDPTRVET